MGLIPLQLVVTGTQVNYFYICPVKLWCFSHHLQMEHHSELVAIGRFIDEESYAREKKNELVEGAIMIDFIKKGNSVEIHEIKKSLKMEKAHEMQALYYAYFLKKRGVEDIRVILDYPLLRERRESILTLEKEKELEYALQRIEEVVSKPTPPEPKRVPYCKKCAYYELCWGD
ncbi:MAG: CRISPR-associated protein Cas4 [Candidatus Micrarchaeia archaeon]